MSEKKILALVAAFLLLNVFTFFVYGIDKWKARHNKWRIPESILLGLAIIGGSFGALLAMKMFHHKTLHKRFRYGVPLIIIAQVIIAVLVFTYLDLSLPF